MTTIRLKEIKRMMLLFCTMVVAAACTSSPLVDVSVSSSTAASTATVMPSPSPAVTSTLAATSAPTPSPAPTFTLTPTATPDPAAICRTPGEDGRIFVISDEELQGRGVDWRKEVLREAIRIYYPGWAEYTQQLTFGKMVVTYDLAHIVHDAGGSTEEVPYITVNPWVILTVLVLEYGEMPPPDFDAWEAANNIAADIKYAYADASTRPVIWQDRFTNAGSYVMYKMLEEDEGQLRQWCVAYHTVYALSRQIMEP